MKKPAPKKIAQCIRPVTQSDADQQLSVIEDVRIQIITKKKELLEIEHRLWLYERGLQEMQAELRKAA
jgi:hypothetical protein